MNADEDCEIQRQQQENGQRQQQEDERRPQEEQEIQQPREDEKRTQEENEIEQQLENEMQEQQVNEIRQRDIEIRQQDIEIRQQQENEIQQQQENEIQQQQENEIQQQQENEIQQQQEKEIQQEQENEIQQQQENEIQQQQENEIQQHQENKIQQQQEKEIQQQQDNEQLHQHKNEIQEKEIQEQQKNEILQQKEKDIQEQRKNEISQQQEKEIQQQQDNEDRKLLAEGKQQVFRDDNIIRAVIGNDINVSEFEQNVFRFVDVSEGSSEYEIVSFRFRSTTKPYAKILRIQRIENPYVKALYELKKLELKTTMDTIREEYLFHGTKHANIYKIAERNFNHRLCGTAKGTKFGRGVSFTPISFYATHYSNILGGEKLMILSLVLCNKIGIGNCCTRVPPPGCDTTKSENGKVIVKYDDDVFYPKYIIYYTV